MPRSYVYTRTYPFYQARTDRISVCTDVVGKCGIRCSLAAGTVSYFVVLLTRYSTQDRGHCRGYNTYFCLFYSSRIRTEYPRSTLLQSTYYYSYDYYVLLFCPSYRIPVSYEYVLVLVLCTSYTVHRTYNNSRYQQILRTYIAYSERAIKSSRPHQHFPPCVVNGNGRMSYPSYIVYTNPQLT